METNGPKLVACPTCGREMRPGGGFAKHTKSCQMVHAMKEANEKAEARQAAEPPIDPEFELPPRTPEQVQAILDRLVRQHGPSLDCHPLRASILTDAGLLVSDLTPARLELAIRHERSSRLEATRINNANPNKTIHIVEVGDPEFDPAAEYDPKPSLALDHAAMVRRHNEGLAFQQHKRETELKSEADKAIRLLTIRRQREEYQSELSNPFSERTGPMATKKNGKHTSKPKTTKATAKAPKEAKDKKPSALDAAHKLLVEVGKPMGTKDMIDQMAAKGYWTSPGGKTPHATLYAAIIKEIEKKGKESRFVKHDRGLFAAK